MTDREALQFAARAALGRTSIPDQHVQMVEKGWNPLDDDGDAQRLIVRLYMTVRREAARAVVSADHPLFSGKIVVPFIAEDAGEHIGTRRPIVACAAEIGKRMEQS